LGCKARVGSISYIRSSLFCVGFQFTVCPSLMSIAGER